MGLKFESSVGVIIFETSDRKHVGNVNRGGGININLAMQSSHPPLILVFDKRGIRPFHYHHDYEILLTAPAKSALGLHSAAGAAGIALTEIGRIVEPSETGAAVLVDADGRPVILKKAGWTHA